MKCPKCFNKNFLPTSDIKKALQNTGQKVYYESFITRRYICNQCGHQFLSEERFHRDVHGCSCPYCKIDSSTIAS